MDAADALATAVEALAFPAPVAYVYNPLVYARAAHHQYIARFGGTPKRVVLLGMNPGPHGMAQTGVPFGEVTAVTTWLRIDAPVTAPARTHTKRPVEGLATQRHEVSGARLWGAIQKAHPDPQTFFADHFVVNYCPLLFLDDGARNLTPDKFPKQTRTELEAACDAHLRRVLAALTPEVVFGVGGFAQKRAQHVVGAAAVPRVAVLPHPSPASPQANRGWNAIARAAVQKAGVAAFL